MDPFHAQKMEAHDHHLPPHMTYGPAPPFQHQHEHARVHAASPTQAYPHPHHSPAPGHSPYLAHQHPHPHAHPQQSQRAAHEPPPHAALYHHHPQQQHHLQMRAHPNQPGVAYPPPAAFAPGYHHPQGHHQYGNIAHFSPSTQDILRHTGAHSPRASHGTPEWEAARQQVMRGMAQTAQQPFTPGHVRGGVKVDAIPATPTSATSDSTKAKARVGAKSKGKASRGKGKGKKRKRDEDEDDGVEFSEDESDLDLANSEDGSEQAVPQTTVTKSGRSVHKPSQFNPAAETTPGSSAKRKRSYRKLSQQIVCVKCSRAHSVPSNVIVLCDGCDCPYHQWCHDPNIERDFVEREDKPWFCSKCQHEREVERLPLEARVSGKGMSEQEKSTYFSTLSKETLAALLVRATNIHPDLPVFPPPPTRLKINANGLKLRLESAQTPNASQQSTSGAPQPPMTFDPNASTHSKPGNPHPPTQTPNQPPSSATKNGIHPAEESSGAPAVGVTDTSTPPTAAAVAADADADVDTDVDAEASADGDADVSANTSPEKAPTTSATTNPTSPAPAPATTGPNQDHYPDYTPTGAEGRPEIPPQMYPLPGRGPIKLRPTTDPEDVKYMVDSNWESFNHYARDGDGELKPVAVGEGRVAELEGSQRESDDAMAEEADEVREEGG